MNTHYEEKISNIDFQNAHGVRNNIIPVHNLSYFFYGTKVLVRNFMATLYGLIAVGISNTWVGLGGGDECIWE